MVVMEIILQMFHIKMYRIFTFFFFEKKIIFSFISMQGYKATVHTQTRRET